MNSHFYICKLTGLLKGTCNLDYKKKGQQLNYVGQESTHTPGTLCTIPSRVLNCLAKLTSRNPSIQSEAVDKIYPTQANALRKAGIAPPVFPTMGDLCRNQDENTDNEKERDVSQKKTENVLLLCCILTLIFYVNPQSYRQARKVI